MEYSSRRGEIRELNSLPRVGSSLHFIARAAQEVGGTGLSIWALSLWLSSLCYAHFSAHYVCSRGSRNSYDNMKNTVWFYLHEVTEVAKIIEIESRMVVATGWGREKGVLVFTGYRVSIWEDENDLE